MRLYGKGENSGPSLLQAQLVRDNLFGLTDGEKEKRLLLAQCAGLSFLDIYGQSTMTNEGAKRNVRTYCKHNSCVVQLCCACSRCGTFLLPLHCSLLTEYLYCFLCLLRALLYCRLWSDSYEMKKKNIINIK